MDLTTEECTEGLDVVKSTRVELLHEAHHTDTRSFDDLLNQRVSVNEQLRQRLKEPKS